MSNLFEAAKRIAKELTAKERLQLAKDLTRSTRQERWNQLFADIDQRVKRYGAPSEDEIIRLCREVRRARASKSRRRS